MSKIQITREYSLDKNNVRNEIQLLAEKLGSELSVEYSWQEDRLLFNRSGVDGFIELGDGELLLEIKLGMLLTPLKGKIETTIRDYLEQHLS